MKYRKLGSTGIKVSVIGLGGIPLQRISIEESKCVIEAAKETGINYIDTAKDYTDSEIKIGLSGYSNDLYVFSKSKSTSKDGIIADVKNTINNINKDVVDLFQLHNVKTLDWSEPLEGLRLCHEDGLINHIGASSHSIDIAEKLIQSGDFSVVTIALNFIEREGIRLLDLADEYNVGILAMKPLIGGAISQTNIVPAISYVLEQNISSVMVGMDRVEQVLNNVKAVDYTLTDYDRGYLAHETSELKDDLCRRCGYCLPCSAGIDIPKMFLLYTYHVRYGLHDWSNDRYKIEAYNASECIECGKCEGKCPYNISIINKMKEVHNLFGD